MYGLVAPPLTIDIRHELLPCDIATHSIEYTSQFTYISCLMDTHSYSLVLLFIQEMGSNCL